MVLGLLTVEAFLSLLWSTGSGAPGLSSWGHGLSCPQQVEPSGPGIEPVFPALAGNSQPLYHPAKSRYKFNVGLIVKKLSLYCVC